MYANRRGLLRTPVLVEIGLLAVALAVTPFVMWLVQGALYRQAKHELRVNVQKLIDSVIVASKESAPPQKFLNVPRFLDETYGDGAGEQPTSAELAVRAQFFTKSSHDEAAAREFLAEANLLEEVCHPMEKGWESFSDPVLGKSFWLHSWRLPRTADLFANNVLTPAGGSLESTEDAALVRRRSALRSFFSRFREDTLPKLLRIIAGDIQWWTVFVFLFGMSVVVYRVQRGRLERRCILNLVGEVMRDASRPAVHVTGDKLTQYCETWQRKANQAEARTAAHNLFGNVLRWLRDAMIGPDAAKPAIPNKGEVVARMDSEAESLRKDLDSAYVPAEYALWCIPTLGFLGTVVGISNAMLGSDRLLAASGKAQQAAAIQNVTLELAYAFDTTWVALLLGIYLMLGMQFVRRWEESQVRAVEDASSTLIDLSRI